MLRIQIEDSPGLVTLRLEGELISPWADELFKAWKQVTDRLPPARPVRLDLDGVSFVDEPGKSVLRVLSQAGCQLQGSGPFTASIIEEITPPSPARPAPGPGERS
jgi:ABC-type transporter Mla MlaB component